MKVITIPERFGYPTVDITVNGIEHTLETGVEVEVDDNVAAVVENALALAPKYGRAGGKIAQLAEGSIEEITIGDLQGITGIRGSGFYNCGNIKNVAIPDSVNTIGSHAFYSCVKIESVALGNGLTKIFASVFDGCKSLTSVYLPETPPTLVDINAFANINPACVFYCKSQESMNAYKAATNWSTLAGTYTFAVKP